MKEAKEYLKQNFSRNCLVITLIFFQQKDSVVDEAVFSEHKEQLNEAIEFKVVKRLSGGKLGLTRKAVIALNALEVIRKGAH